MFTFLTLISTKLLSFYKLNQNIFKNKKGNEYI